VKFRTFAEVRPLFADLELVEPGLVPIAEWRPDPGTPVRSDYGLVLSMACAGVARKPGDLGKYSGLGKYSDLGEPADLGFPAPDAIAVGQAGQAGGDLAAVLVVAGADHLD
jgi:hypothetical protein